MTVEGAVEAQFARAWEMLRSAVHAFPATEWLDADDRYLVPSGLCYDIVEAADYYCRGSAEGFGGAAASEPIGKALRLATCRDSARSSTMSTTLRLGSRRGCRRWAMSNCCCLRSPLPGRAVARSSAPSMCFGASTVTLRSST